MMRNKLIAVLLRVGITSVVNAQEETSQDQPIVEASTSQTSVWAVIMEVMHTISNTAINSFLIIFSSSKTNYRATRKKAHGF